MITLIGDFLLSQWIWSITFDWMHPFYAGAVMFLMLYVLYKETFVRSGAFSIIVNLFSFLGFSLLIVSSLIIGLEWKYTIPSDVCILDPSTVLVTCMYLAIIYSILQLLFLGFLRIFWKFSLKIYIPLVIVSNGSAALVSFVSIRMLLCNLYS